jgi:thiosulfate sulfurtransferase
VSEFERGYFDGDAAYGGQYDRRNPPYKWRAMAGFVARHKGRGRLVDVGCAYGAFLGVAAGRWECWGTDISDHAVGVATERVSGATVVPGGLFDAELPVGTFDVVCLFDVIEHIADLDAAFARIDELLAPGGLLVLSVPVYDGPLGGLVHLLDKDPTHVHKWARGAWLRELTDRGWRVRAWEGIFRYFLGGRVYLHRQTRRLRDVGTAVIIAAERAEVRRGATQSEPDPAPASSAAAGSSAEPSPSPGIVEVDCDEALALLEADAATFIDVRDGSSYAYAHVPGALHVGDHNIGEFVASADKDRTVVVYCYHGNSSLGGAAYLTEHGFADARSMAGGFTAWHSRPSEGE